MDRYGAYAKAFGYDGMVDYLMWRDSKLTARGLRAREMRRKKDENTFDSYMKRSLDEEYVKMRESSSVLSDGVAEEDESPFIEEETVVAEVPPKPELTPRQKRMMELEL